MVASQTTVEYAELLRSLEKLNNRLGISHLTATETTIFLAIANNKKIFPKVLFIGFIWA